MKFWTEYQVAMNLHPLDDKVHVFVVFLSRHLEMRCDSTDKLQDAIYRGTLKIDGFFSLFQSDLLLSSPLRIVLKENIKQK
jgi:hypothetical protein